MGEWMAYNAVMLVVQLGLPWLSELRLAAMVFLGLAPYASRVVEIALWIALVWIVVGLRDGWADT